MDERFVPREELDAKFERLDVKLDKLIETCSKFLVIETKVDSVEKRLSDLEKDHEKLKLELYKWINRGFGAYGVLVAVLAIYGKFAHGV